TEPKAAGTRCLGQSHKRFSQYQRSHKRAGESPRTAGSREALARQDRSRMAKSVNKVILVGRLGRDPELKYTASGVPFCRFSMATDDSWNDKGTGERQERTEWHNIVAWDRLAEICNQYLTKGKLIYIEGSLQTREWDDQEGNKKKITEIRARDMVMLSGGAGDSAGGGPRRAVAAEGSSSNTGGGGTSTITDDDIPF